MFRERVEDLNRSINQLLSMKKNHTISNKEFKSLKDSLLRGFLNEDAMNPAFGPLERRQLSMHPREPEFLPDPMA